MNNSENKRAPSFSGWVIAAGAGLVAAAVAHVVGHFSYPQSGFVGLGIFLLVGLILGMYWGPQAVAEAKPVAPALKIVPAVQPMAVAAAPAAVMAAPIMPDVVVPTPTPAAPTPAPVMAEAAPAAFVSAPAAPAPASGTKPAPVPKPKGAPVAKVAPVAKAAAKPAAPKVAKVKKPDGPERLSAPRKGIADDLKEIEGIGPALEKLCNALGFYHFDQIAKWSAEDVAWVDANMKTFKGRIVRDKWIAQSKIIITEGLEAFRVRAKTNNY